MKRSPPLLWLSAAYFLISVCFNVWELVPTFQFWDGVDRLLLVANLASNFIGAVGLIMRLRAGLYLLVVGFLTGAAGQVRSIEADGWHVPLSVVSFAIPAVIILYCVHLARVDILKRVFDRLHEKKVDADATARTFD